jgi:phospholipase C
MPGIEHLVVLMLENRSFDHLLGFYTPADGGQRVDGLRGDESNPVDPFAQGPKQSVVPVRRTSGVDGYVTDPDPPHDHDSVMVQLFCESRPAEDREPNNLGFYYRYSQVRDHDAPLAPDVAAHVMRCFSPAEQLPALNGLAQQFTVLDRWFASVPGPTWPNRFFCHCATSGGHAANPGALDAVIAAVGRSKYPMPTVFEKLEEAGATWRIYYHDVPQSLDLGRLHAHLDHFSHYCRFLRDAAAGTLPSYAFIEPAYFDVPVLGLWANDMHPPHDARRGDRLIAEVYAALRASPLWNRCALLVIWDEHGGFYDHVKPAKVVAPDDEVDASGFRFDRLGVRLPAVLASPWVARGRVDSTPFEHASVAATLRALFGTTGFLSRRDASAAAFDHLFDQRAPRTDTPLTLPSAELGPAALVSPLTDHQRSLLALAEALRSDDASPPVGSDRVASAILHTARFLDV